MAWRHLRDPERRIPRTLIVGGVLVGAGRWLRVAASYLVERQLEPPPGFLRGRPPVWSSTCAPAGIIGHRRLGLLITYLGVLFASFTVFTAISIFGVFLGTAAPIIALSVMSGFEADLKGKIRGAKADVVITRADDGRSPNGGRCARRSPACPGCWPPPLTSRAR